MKRLMKFFVVGGLGVPVHLGILYGLTEAGLFYIVSAIIAVFFSISLNYFMNHYWTFKDRHTTKLATGYFKYLLVGSVSDSIYLGLLSVAVSVLHIYYILAAGVLIISLGLIRYTIISKWIWRKQKHESLSETILG
jgi:dolichol-phosphate mannosyltransferase